MAANRTWLETTDEVLQLAGLPRIVTAEKFNNNAILDNDQSRTKYFVRLGHYHNTTSVMRQFNERLVELLVSNATNVYDLDIGINPATITYRSFFNVTESGNTGGPLDWFTEEEYTALYPDESQIPTGAPTHVILLTSKISDVTDTPKVKIHPKPDATYTLRYKAALKPYALENASSIILWPDYYDYVLWEWAWHMLERGLGEGKEGYILQLAKEAFKDVKLISTVPDDIRKSIQTIGPIDRGRRGWMRNRYRYPSPPDTP